MSDRDGRLSFSVVIETENLATAELDALFRALDALEAQEDLSVKDANEVILINSGRVDDETLATTLKHYPWLTQHSSRGAAYYETKMLGADLTSGEVVVFCDSDCTYSPGWLRELLAPFRSDAEVQVVSGETATDESGLYGIAMRMTYIFPPFSSHREPYPASAYMMNNVAFRRSLLLERPIPLGLPIYRGNCLLHGRALQRMGITLWMSPQARSVHPPPETLRHFAHRFLLLGRDAYLVQRIDSHETGARPAIGSLSLRVRILVGKVARAFRRAFSPGVEAPLPVRRALAAAPIAALSLVLYAIGLFAASLRPPTYEPQRGADPGSRSD